MNQREHLLHQVARLEELAKTQQAKYDLATKCLSQTQASVAVSKMAVGITRVPFTEMELEEFQNAVKNSVQGVTDALTGLGEMRREIGALRSALVMLPE